MAKTKTTLRFWLRTDLPNRDGTAPIHLIYQISGQRKYYAVPDSGILPCYWDAKNQQIIHPEWRKSSGAPGRKKIELEEINQRLTEVANKLENVRAKVKAIEIELSERGIPITVQLVVDKLKDTGKLETKKITSNSAVFDFIDQYILDHSKQRVKGSLSVYRSLSQHLKDFQDANKRDRVTFENIDQRFFTRFSNFLASSRMRKTEAGKLIALPMLNNITIAKQLRTLKTLLNYARKQDIEVCDKYRDFKIKKEDPEEVIALTKKEFETLYNLDLSGKPAWDRVRDTFIFSCVTGLRYSDVAQLNWEQIKDNYIELTTIKTGNKIKVPLTPYSKAILGKYKGQPKPLPVISNQKSNEHLAEICKHAGIDGKIEIVRKRGAERLVNTYPKYELIRFHCGRKTFATLSLEAGMSVEYVMKIGGWRSYASFKRYMNLTDNKAQEAMLAAWGGEMPKLKAV